MDDIVAVEVRLADGESRYVLTWGRVQDPVDPHSLADVVLARSRNFDLGGEPIWARVRWYLNAAAGEPYFHECLAGLVARRSAADYGTPAWLTATDAAMREGRELYYCGRHRLREPDEPHSWVSAAGYGGT